MAQVELEGPHNHLIECAAVWGKGITVQFLLVKGLFVTNTILQCLALATMPFVSLEGEARYRSSLSTT